MKIKNIFKRSKSPEEIEIERLNNKLATLDPVDNKDEYSTVLTARNNLVESMNETKKLKDKVSKDVLVKGVFIVVLTAGTYVANQMGLTLDKPGKWTPKL